MIDPDVYAAFAAWYVKDVEGDDLLGNTTPDEAIEFAVENRCLDEVLMLPGSGVKHARILQQKLHPPVCDSRGNWMVVSSILFRLADQTNLTRSL